MGVAASSSSVVRLRAGVEVVDASTQVSYILPLAAVDYIALHIEAELDSSNRNPFVAETLAVVDSRVIHFAKAASESVALSDTAPLLAVNKGLSESISFSENVIRLLIFIRDFADTLGVSDALAVELAKTIADAASVADFASRELAKTIPDGVAMNDGADTSDGLLVVITKSFTNMAFVADVKTVDFVKAITDAANPVDALFLQYSKVLNDSFMFADTLTRQVALSKSDSVALADLISIALIVGRSLSDTFSLVDSIVLNFNKGLFDSASVDDAGSLISQGYCDITYFAEDYVGESRTFT